MGEGNTCSHIKEIMSQENTKVEQDTIWWCYHHAKKIQGAPFGSKILINITLLVSYTRVLMLVNGPLDGHAHLKSRGLALMNDLKTKVLIIKVESSSFSP
jgi:hypothetical protein